MDQTFSLLLQSFISFGQFSPSGRSGFMGWSLLYRYIFLSQINIFRGIAQFNHHKNFASGVRLNIDFIMTLKSERNIFQMLRRIIQSFDFKGHYHM